MDPKKLKEVTGATFYELNTKKYNRETIEFVRRVIE